MKIKFEIETKNGKKLSFADLKKMAKEVINTAAEKADEAMKKAEEAADEAATKAAPKVQKAQEKAQGFVDSAIEFADKAIEKVEDYIDQKLAEEKDAGPDDITEEFFEDDEEETSADETVAEETGADETVAEETSAYETGADETGAEETSVYETGADETGADETDAGETCVTEKSERKVNTISLTEFLDKIVGFKKAEEDPDVSEQTEGFLCVIKYFASDVSKAAFKAAVQLSKITYASVINAIEKDFPEMTNSEMKKFLQADFKNWVNARFPDLKEECPNANCVTLMKYWAKKFSEFEN